MADEQLAEGGLGNPEGEAIDDQIVDDQVNDGEGEGDPEHTETELKAMEHGWTPQDDFKGNKDNWRNAKQFLEYGDMRSKMDGMQTQMKGMKKSHEESITNLNVFNKANNERQLADLKNQISAAAEEGDADKTNALVEQHASLVAEKTTLETPVQAPSAQNDQILQGEWELANQWIYDPSDPRANAAQTSFNLAKAKGMTMAESLAFVDDNISGISKTKVNPNRSLPSSNSSSGGQGKASKVRKITMSEVSNAELAIRAAFPDGAEGDKIFLQSVQDSRKGV